MRVLFSLIFLSLFLYSQTINEQIHALQEATPKERVALMNSIKEQLVTMNEEKRMQTIEALREKLHGSHEVDEAYDGEIKSEDMQSKHMEKDMKVEEMHQEQHSNMMQQQETQHMQEEIMMHQEEMQMHTELFQQEQHEMVEETTTNIVEHISPPSHKIDLAIGTK